MSETCPKCGSPFKESHSPRNAAGEIRYTTRWFNCGSTESVDAGGGLKFKQVAACQIAQLDAQLAAEKKGREEAEAKYNELASRIDGYPRTCDVERIARLTTVLGMCRNELAWLMEQTGAKEGGSVWRAYEAATAALLQPQGGCDE